MSGVRVPAPPPSNPVSPTRLRRLEPLLRAALRGPCAVLPGRPLLVAVSGGADSTALLLGLRNLSRELGLPLVAAHLHHGLRGADADQDLEFVRGLCARAGVPLVSARWNTRLRMARRGLSGEAGLRTLRREFLLRAARRTGAAAIATAHTADDQLETLLMRLGRGTGLAGLAGMRPRRGAWLKPLLGATRSDVEEDLRAMAQPWRNDRSNLDPAHTRNRVRHVALPALIRALDPTGNPARARAELARKVARAMGEARAAAEALETLAAEALPSVSRIQPGEIALDSNRVRSYPFAARRMILRELWGRLDPSLPGLTDRHLEALSSLLAGTRGGARVALAGGWSAVREQGWVRFRRLPVAGASKRAPLSIPGAVRWSEGHIDGRWTTGSEARRRLARKSSSDEFFAAEDLHGELELRAARREERFIPFGRTRPVRLDGFLRRERIGTDVKHPPPVLADAGGILWVVGVRRAARAPVDGSTRKALWVHAERHD